MKDVILIYEDHNYWEEGGGKKVLLCDDEQEMIKEVNSLNESLGDKFEFIGAYNLRSEIKIKSKEFVSKYVITNES